MRQFPYGRGEALSEAIPCNGFDDSQELGFKPLRFPFPIWFPFSLSAPFDFLLLWLFNQFPFSGGILCFQGVLKVRNWGGFPFDPSLRDTLLGDFESGEKSWAQFSVSLSLSNGRTTKLEDACTRVFQTTGK